MLGGGGAYGVVQAAYIHAALEAGFRPSLVVGTSVGSLNGAWVARRPDDKEELLRIWMGLDRLRILHFNPIRVVHKIARGPRGLCQNTIVPRLIKEHVEPLRFEDLALPLAVVATNLSRSRKHVFSSGDLGQAILASTAIPGIYDPIEIDGEFYADGGLSASVDLVTALEMGATEILAIDLTPAPPTFRSRTVVGVLRHSLGILSRSTTDAMEAAVGRQMPVSVIRPDLSAHSPWRLDDSAATIAKNLEMARATMRDVLDRDGHVQPFAPPALTDPSARQGARDPSPVDFRRFVPQRSEQAG